jgi:hypothetical protein
VDFLLAMKSPNHEGCLKGTEWVRVLETLAKTAYRRMKE